MLVGEQLLHQVLLVLHVAEAGQLLELDRAVQLEVRADGGQLQLLRDLLLEDADLDLVRLLALVARAVEVRHGRQDELGAGVGEGLVEGHHLAALHAQHLLRVLLAQGAVHVLVHALARAQRHGDGQEREHLVVPLVDLVAVGHAREVLLVARNVQYARGEGLDGVHVAAVHHLREALVEVHGDVADRHAHREHVALIEVLPALAAGDGVEHLHGGVVVAEEDVRAAEHDHTEVADGLEHLGHRGGRVFRVVLGGAKGLFDAGGLDQLLHVAKHEAGGPGRLVLLEQGDLVRCAVLGLAAVLAEGLELVQELVHEVEGPLRRQHVNVDVLVVAHDAVEEGEVVVEGVEAVLEGRHGRLQLGEHVAVAQLLVQAEEGRVVLDQRRHGGGGRPRGLLVVVVRQLGPLVVVRHLHVCSSRAKARLDCARHTQCQRQGAARSPSSFAMMRNVYILEM